MDLSSLIPYLLNTYYTPSNLRIQCLCNHGLSILIQKQKFSHGDKFLEQNKGRQHWEMVKALQPAWLVLNHSFTATCVHLGTLLNLLKLPFPQHLHITYFIEVLLKLPTIIHSGAWHSERVEHAATIGKQAQPACVPTIKQGRNCLWKVKQKVPLACRTYLW